MYKKEEEEAQSYTYAKWDNSPFVPLPSKDVYFLQGKARNLHSSNQGKGEEEEEDGKGRKRKDRGRA